MNYTNHPNSEVQSLNTSNGTHIWQFVVFLPNAKLGTDCNICSHVLIENDVVIGDLFTVKSGMQLWDGMRIDGDVFIVRNVTLTNDFFPCSKQSPPAYSVTTVKNGAYVWGGGDDPARLKYWQECHGGRVYGGNEVGTRQRRGRWRPGTHLPLPRGQR